MRETDLLNLYVDILSHLTFDSLTVSSVVFYT